MKKTWIVLGLLIAGLSRSTADPGGVSFDLFYSSLSPQGEWISCDAGVYAWRPFGVAAGWRPYYNGRWCWTDDGWYWASDEPWAWATYHYGRWYYDDVYGWVWIPGYDWAPAWVEWQYGGDCVGWAPLSPYAVFSVGFGVRYRSSWITPRYWWSFVDCRHFADPDVHRFVFRTENNSRYIGRTRPAGSVRYDGGRIVSRGPDRGYIESRGNIRVGRVEIRDVADRPTDRLVRDAGRERVEVYRPKIEDRGAGDRAMRPERIRQGDHRVFPDTRGLDIRARDIDREAGRGTSGIGQPRTREEPQVQRPTPRQRSDAPSYEREQRRGARQQGNNGQDMRQRRGDTRAAQPDWRGRRPDAPRVDRAPAPRREPPRSEGRKPPESRGGGRRR